MAASGRPAIAPLVEAFAFTALVLIDIWFLHSRYVWGDAVPGLFALASLIIHRESLGLGIRDFTAAFRAWWLVLLISLIAVGMGLSLMDHPFHLLLRGMIYFAWCILQQLVYQNVVYKRVRDALGPTWRASLLSGTLFAIAHIPNPVLIPATFVWGTISTRLYESHPSVFAIALLQALFSSLLIWSTPVGWNHQFRVGPGYWTYR